MNKKLVALKIGKSPSTALGVHGKQGNGNGKDYGHFKKIGTRSEQLIPLDDGEISHF